MCGGIFAHMDNWMLSYRCLKVSKDGEAHLTNIKRDVIHQTYQHLRDGRNPPEDLVTTREEARGTSALYAESSKGGARGFKWNVVVFAFLGIPHKNVYFKFQRCIHVASEKQPKTCVLCFAFCIAAEYWFDIDVLFWPLNSGAYFCVPPPPSLFLLPWLGVCFDGSVHWENLVNAMTSDSWGTHMCVWDSESKAMSPGRQRRCEGDPLKNLFDL